jgi:hypothetical protein
VPLTQPGVVGVVTSLGWTSRRLEGTKWVEVLLGSFGKWRLGRPRKRLGEHKTLYPAKQMAKEASKYCRVDERSNMKSGKIQLLKCAVQTVAYSENREDAT